MAKLTVFHTGDFHNSLDTTKADRLKALKEQTPNSLLLDAGDAIWAGNIYVRPGGEPALRLMSDAGYDAVVAGNESTLPVQNLGEDGVALAGRCAGPPVQGDQHLLS